MRRIENNDLEKISGGLNCFAVGFLTVASLAFPWLHVANAISGDATGAVGEVVRCWNS